MIDIVEPSPSGELDTTGQGQGLLDSACSAADQVTPLTVPGRPRPDSEASTLLLFTAGMEGEGGSVDSASHGATFIPPKIALVDIGSRHPAWQRLG